MRGVTTMAALVLLAAAFAVLALLYAIGTIGFLASGEHAHHYKHAVVLGGLAVLSLVAASFARPRVG